MSVIIKCYLCPHCKKVYNRTVLPDGYVHPCTDCHCKIIELPYNEKQIRQMQTNGTWIPYANKIVQEYKSNPNYKPKPQKEYYDLPKCPTCGSTNIRHISGTERAANIFAFGLLGNKRKCQFECQNPNCRYRW